MIFLDWFISRDFNRRRYGPGPREVKLDLLSPQERAYLLGLYFTDGCVMVLRRRSLGGVVFYLSEGEEELAERISSVFRRLGLNPVVRPPRKKRMVSVSVCGMLLFRGLFPDKRQFLGLGLNDGLVSRWLVLEGLQDNAGRKVSNLAVPFIGGLLDGDGRVEASLCFDRSVFGYIEKEWYFSQRKYPFLVDYLVEFLGQALGTKRGSFTCFVRRTSVRITGLLSVGHQLLLRLGLAKWSWKVDKWLKKVERLEREHADLMASFLTTHEVAKRVHVNPKSVFDWCRKGRVKHICIRSFGARHYTRLIPANELEQLVKAVRQRRADESRVISARHDGRLVTTREVSHVLNLSLCRVRQLCREGKLRAICLPSLFGSKKKRYLIPAGEVERLIAERAGTK
jgi:hypothetical protein